MLLDKQKLREVLVSLDRVELVPIPDYGDAYPLDIFFSLVKSNILTSEDGVGCYATDKGMINKRINLKEMAEGTYDERWTHVIWFNK